jgi:hypothetical protein
MAAGSGTSRFLPGSPGVSKGMVAVGLVLTAEGARRSDPLVVFLGLSALGFPVAR